MSLWNPDLAAFAVTAPEVEPLELPEWDCSPSETQTRGIVWLYATPRAFLADGTGTGKTIHGIGLTALLRAKGEISDGRRAVIVVLPGTVGQWREEFASFLPSAEVVSNQGLDRAERRALYRADWEVLITSYDLMWRDAEILASLRPQLVFFDESSTFRNRSTRTAEKARLIGSHASRIVCASATPIENTLEDLFSQLEVLGLAGSATSLFGTEAQFNARYLIQEPQTVFVRGRRQVTKMRTTGYVNMDDLRQKLAPFYLRRNDASDDMPDLAPPEDIPVPLTERQRTVYNDLVAQHEGGDRFALANLSMRLLQVTSGLANIGLEDESAKLDWVLQALSTRYHGEKVVVFSKWLPTVVSLGRRLRGAGIGHEVISGAASPSERDYARSRFWEDPDCRLMVITLAGEKGLNLQIAKHVVMVDLLWNPARVEQIIGRVKRRGSPHDTVHLDRLITPGSIETGVLKINRYKQALADTVNDEESELFQSLTEDELRTVIRG